MRMNAIKRRLGGLCVLTVAQACTLAHACSPPPPLDSQAYVLAADGKGRRLYNQQSFAFQGVVIGPATSKEMLDQDNQPAQGIRVRVVESMTPMSKAGAEVDIFVRTMSGAGCEIRSGVNYRLPAGTRFMFESRYLILGDWELKNLQVIR